MYRQVMAASRAGARRFLLLFGLFASLRLSLLPFAPLNPQWTIRTETGAVAESVVRTGEYANPYAIPTGPTGHPVPFETGIVAALFWAFGFSMAAEYGLYLVHTAGFSAMYAMLPWLAERVGAGTRAGVAGAILGALNPATIVPGGLGEDYAGIAIGLLMAVSLSRWTSDRISVRGSFLLGLGWGAAFHISPPLLLVMVGCAGFELWWRTGGRKWLLVAAIVAGASVACAPWTWRNHRALGDFVFIRSNFGLELRMGNHAGAFANLDDPAARGTHRHPRTDLDEARLVREHGELAYMRRARDEAARWIADHPGGYLRLVVMRAAQWWLGPFDDPFSMMLTTLMTALAIWGGWRILPQLTVPDRAAILIPLAAFPIAYYVISYLPRYRIPLDVFVLVLAGAGVTGGIDWARGRRESR